MLTGCVSGLKLGAALPFASENPGWGTIRSKEALANLGHGVSDQSAKASLRATPVVRREVLPQHPSPAKCDRRRCSARRDVVDSAGVWNGGNASGITITSS